MPPHTAIYAAGVTPAPAVPVALNGGETSAVFTREIWNDKDGAFDDTTTAQGIRLQLLASSIGNPFVGSGIPVLDERWTTARIVAYLTADGETTEGATGTQPFGTFADLALNDLPPQTGARIELQVNTPGGRTLAVTRLRIAIDGNRASAPLSKFTALATGSGIVPPDRLQGVRSLMEGSEVTADSTDTITVGRGLLAYEGVVYALLAEDVTFDLNDSAAAALLAGEAYRVTLSRSPIGALVATKSVKGAATYPAVPDGNVYVANLTATSPDGVAVTVAAAGVLQEACKYTGYAVRAGAGLTVLVGRGDGVTSADHRQYQPHEIPVALPALSTSRVWRLTDGTITTTLTDAPPEFDADLLALATTDAANVTAIIDARRLIHRALNVWPIELRYSDVISQIDAPAFGLAWTLVHFDCEIEAVELNLTAADETWTAGAVKVDVIAFAPGAPIPFPAGGEGVGGVSLFTNSADDDARPSIAFNATSLRAISRHHEVRRIVAGTRLLLAIVETVTAPDPEADQEIRVTLHARRYR